MGCSYLACDFICNYSGKTQRRVQKTERKSIIYNCFKRGGGGGGLGLFVCVCVCVLFFVFVYLFLSCFVLGVLLLLCVRVCVRAFFVLVCLVLSCFVLEGRRLVFW